MKEELVVTARWLDKHNACLSGMRWFANRFHDGAKISEVLIKLVCDESADGSWVPWLMSRAKYYEADWIEKLPKHVGGSLDLEGCTGLTSLPENLSVGGYLYLRGCTGLTSLPENLSVGGYLDLRGCTGLKRSKIPNHLKNNVVS